jgi:acetyl-CoA C-acetyltransferase
MVESGAAGAGAARRVVVVGAARTACGGLGGALSSVAGPELAGAAMRAALAQARVSADQVDEVFLGNVLPHGQGQAPCKQAARAAGLPWSVPCTLVNKVCASGMKAVMLGAASVRGGESSRVVLCGGFESMSRVPYLSAHSRFGHKFGHVQLQDGLVRDALRDAYSDEAMGCCANLIACELGISREAQDRFAARSYARARAATLGGNFAREVAPVRVRGKKGAVEVVQDEEAVAREVTYESLAALPGAFALPASAAAKFRAHPNANSVTAGNASVISDGASCLALCSEAYAREQGLEVLAVLESWADGATDPEHFTVAPALAMQRALDRAGRTADEVDLFEINEAFAVVPIANMKLLGLEHRLGDTNIYGGGASLGHPLGSSGARILVTMISALLQEQGKQRGLCAICNGGGGASAVLLSRPTTTSQSRSDARL